MPYKTIPAEQAYRIGLLVERSTKLRAQSELIASQAQQTLERARQLMGECGLDPNFDELVTDDAMFRGQPLPVGTVIRQGRPVEDLAEDLSVTEKPAEAPADSVAEAMPS
jgi:hypothetical protein